MCKDLAAKAHGSVVCPTSADERHCSRSVSFWMRKCGVIQAALVQHVVSITLCSKSVCNGVLWYCWVPVSDGDGWTATHW